MKASLLLTLSLASLACAGCAGAEPAPVAPQTPVVVSSPPVVVNLDPPPAAATAPKPAPPAPEEAPPKAEESGVIGLLSTAGGDASPPWGRDDGEAKGNMWGADVGGSGMGGLGLTGVGGSGGQGGGVGLGNLGTVGHRATQKGAKLQAGQTTVVGRLPPEVIQRIVRQHFGRYRACYNAGLQTKPKLEGKIEVKFTIELDGSVSSVSNGAGTTMPEAKVVACVMRAFAALSFPAPEAGKVTVVYPIRFSPGDEVPAVPAAKKP